MASISSTSFYFEKEIEQLKELDCSVKVLPNIGEFSLMIIVKNKSPEFTIRFHFTDDIPNRPTIILLCKDVSSEVISEIQKKFTNNSSSVVHILESVKRQIQNLTADNSISPKSHRKAVQNKKKTKIKKSTDNSNECPINEKKASMKTSMDVVNRILWDDSIPKDQMVIGYLDRFIGVVEKPFYAFSWEDIASLDYYTFAIPKHRITYFKYKKAEVWNKEMRLDNVFGSTGSDKTIVDVIATYNDNDYKDSTDVSSSQSNLPDTNNAALQDSEEEDDVELTVGPGSAPPCSRTSSIVLTDDDDDDDEDVERESMAQQISKTKTYWRDKLRPNFFICFQVTNLEVRNMVSHIQDMICERESLYEECCTPEDLLHVTLCTLRLDSAEQVSQCVEIIRTAEDELRDLLPKSPLPIRGLDRFFGRVLYAKVVANQDFYDFVQHLETLLRANGMPLSDSHDFVPHMSLVKVNRPATRKLGTKTINPLIYYGSENVDFGEQAIDSIYLCSMEKTRGENGFYISPGCCTFKKHIL